jgi:Zn finger protein HypA/HybF involved in hydrogenase expression
MALSLTARRDRKQDAREAEEDAQHDRRSFPCPACGADLRFDPGEAQMRCTHCDTLSPVPHVDDAAAHVENPYEEGLAQEADGLNKVEVQSLNCQNCAASVEFDANEHSRLCPFCDTAIVGDVRAQRTIVPQAILPFSLMRREAEGAMKSWLSTRWFAPNDIAEDAKADHFAGVYVPFWTFDALTETQYVGQRGRRTGSGKNRRTVWSTVTGTVRGPFDDVVVSGSFSVSREFKDALAPWPFEHLETYQTEFLSGFRAENHTVSLRQANTKAKEFMRAVITDWIKSDIGGDRQRITSSKTAYDRETYKHVLAPVWITHYAFEQQSYRLSVNGRTGKVYGQRPFSQWKLLGGSISAICALGVVGYLISAVPWFG